MTQTDSLAASVHLETNNNSTETTNGGIRLGVKLPPLLPSLCSSAASGTLHPPDEDSGGLRMVHSATKLPPIVAVNPSNYGSARPGPLTGWTERSVCPAQLLIDQRRMQGNPSIVRIFAATWHLKGKTVSALWIKL